MKTIIYTLSAIFLMSSCASIEKMVDEGNYNEAILSAARKMSGQKKKKTKHLKYLEEAFAKANNDDLERAERLIQTGMDDIWDDVYHSYMNIQERQDLISPFLPLVSKDGYRASFDFLDVNSELNKAADQAVEFHYSEAVRLMEEARKGAKIAARMAFDEIDILESYTNRYKHSEAIKRDAKFLGTRRVLLTLRNNVPAMMPLAMEEEIMSVYVKDLNTFWTKYYTRMPEEFRADVVADLEIDMISISPEREIIEHYIDTKEIVDGFEYVLDENGNVMKDSLGNDIKVDKYITVTADVTEIFRTKSAVSNGRLVVYDNHTGEKISSSPMNVVAEFESYASSFRGDRRAICDRTRSRLRTYPEAFPSNYTMTMDVAHLLKEFMKDELEGMRI